MTGPATAAASTIPPLPAVRTVDAILTDEIAALGGITALGRHRSLHTTMEITFKGLGITGTAEHYAAAGDRTLTITTIPNLASTREGSDGTRFWSEDPINGLRLLDGAEAEQARVESAWNAELRMKELFPDIAVKNERTEDGGYLECLIMTPRLGPGTTNCFDPKTHLQARQSGMRSSPQGDMPFTARLSDWRAVGDIKIAHATEMQAGPLAFVGRILSVEVDGEIDPALFAIPRTAATDGRGARRKGAPRTSSARKKGVTGDRPPGGQSAPPAPRGPPPVESSAIKRE